MAKHAARVEAQLGGASAAPRRAGLLHLEAPGQETQVVAKLQVQVAPEGRQVQQQGALAGPDSQGSWGRAGAPALSRPGGPGQRRQVHVVGAHPPRQYHLHVGRRVADSCGERGDASARRGPPARPPSGRPPRTGSSAGHLSQRGDNAAPGGRSPPFPHPGTSVPAGASARAPRHPGKVSSPAARSTSGASGAAQASGDPAAALPPGSRLEPGPPPRPAPPWPRALSAVHRRTPAAQAGGGRQDASGE